MRNYTVILLACALFLLSCKKDDAPVDNTPLQALTTYNVAYGNDAQQKMDIYLPGGRKTDSTKVIVMVHGGAWAEGDKADFDPYVAVLRQRFPDYAIFNINYRL